MLSGILSSAISGLNLNSQRVSASADNISNANTPDYKRVEIQAKTLTVDQTSGTSYSPGGVIATSRQLSDVGASIGAINNSTDVGTEFVNLIQAESAYAANLKVVQAGEDMAKQLLDVKA